MWPPNNPDLNPVDYAIRDALQQMAYQLPQRLVNRTTGQRRHCLGCVVQQQGGHIEHLM